MTTTATTETTQATNREELVSLLKAALFGIEQLDIRASQIDAYYRLVDCLRDAIKLAAK